MTKKVFPYKFLVCGRLQLFKAGISLGSSDHSLSLKVYIFIDVFILPLIYQVGQGAMFVLQDTIILDVVTLTRVDTLPKQSSPNRILP